MSDTLSLIYVGDKPMKKDTITGSRLLFPRLRPVPVPADVAYQLLDYPSVWRLADELKAVQAEADAQAQAEAAAQAQAEADARRLAEQQNFKVGDYDLGKLTSAKLKTIAAAEGLELAMGATEKVDDFRVRVRDALKAKLES